MPEKKEKPAEGLARKITERMTNDNLLDADRADKFTRLLVTGKLKEGDWRLEVESNSKARETPKKER